MKTSRTNKFSIGNLVKGRSKPIMSDTKNGFERLTMLGIVINMGIDYPATGNRRSKYAEIKWSNGRAERIHLCYGNWDNVSVIA